MSPFVLYRLTIRIVSDVPVIKPPLATARAA